jgi:hypothetical protein
MSASMKWISESSSTWSMIWFRFAVQPRLCGLRTSVTSPLNPLTTSTLSSVEPSSSTNTRS